MAFTKIVSPGIDTTGSYTVQELNTVGVMTAGTVQVGAATTVHTTGIDLGSGNITSHNINSTGIITATSFVGPVTGDIAGNISGNVTGTATTATNAQGLIGSPSITVTDITASGNVSIAGTLTYEDVTNIDSVGLVTARSGIHVTGGDVGIGTASPTSFGPTLQVAGTDPALLLQDTATAVDYFGANVTSGIAQLWYDDAAAFTINTATGLSGSGLVERLRITSAGDVGIGTAIPITATGYASLSLADTYGAQIEFKKFGGQTHYIWSDNNFNIGADYYGSGQNLVFKVNGNNERVRITSAGNVGIGVTNPDLKLHVNGVNALPSTSGSTPTGHLTLRAKAQSSSHGMFMGVSNASPWSSWIQAQDANNNATEYPLLLNPNGGNIGIGTVNPGSKLTVYETGGNAKLLLQRANTANNTDDYGSVLWRSAGGTAVGAINVARATAENDGYMFFQTANSGTMSEMMRIQPSGYIGIGEVAPGGRLTVRHANTSTSGLNATLKLKQGVATNGNRSSLIFSSLDDYDVAAVNGVVDTHSGTAANNVGHLEFWTKESGNATAQERMRVHPTGQVSINSNGYMGRFHIQQDAITEPPLSIRHHDASFYKHMGTVGPNDRNGTDASSGGTYLHVRVRTVWNDVSMTMFRITGYYPYSDYTHSYVGMYRYGHNSYRTNPYGQTISNLKRATIHSIYNEAASPGYLVFVCNWPTNYNGLMFEHIGAGSVYGSYMQNDLEIIDSLRSTGTSALTF